MTAKPRKRTTPTRSREETVAPSDEGGKTVVLPSVPPTPSETVPVADSAVEPAERSADVVGDCDNHPGVPAVLVTAFPWAVSQKFCRPCVPAQYAYLL